MISSWEENVKENVGKPKARHILLVNAGNFSAGFLSFYRTETFRWRDIWTGKVILFDLN